MLSEVSLKRQGLIAASIVWLATATFGQGCSEMGRVALYEAPSAPLGYTSCLPPPGVSGTPKTIEEAVTLINSLPRPVTISCFLNSLDRPLRMAATNNPISGQPAEGNRSPRIFINYDKLYISVVPAGLGEHLVEFSFMVSVDTSIKAELEFPIFDQVTPQAPYDQVRFNSGTSCGVCHAGEVQTTSVPFATAFVSRALRPTDGSLVDLNALKSEVDICNDANEPHRCSILKSLFGRGAVLNQNFPADMPTFF